MSEPKVVLVSPYRAEGAPTMTGAGASALNWYTSEFVHALHVRGCDASVVGPRLAHEGAWLDRGTRIIPAYRKGHPLYFTQMSNAVRGVRPDVVHVQHELFAYGGLASAFALPLALRAMHGRTGNVLTTIHGVIPMNAIDTAFVRTNGLKAPPFLVRRVWRHLLRTVCAASDVIHVHEPEHAIWLRTQYGVEQCIVVEPIGSATNAGRLDPHVARANFDIPDDARVILFFGYLLERKGIVPFLNAVPALLSNDPKTIVLLAGTTPDRVSGAFDVTAKLRSLAGLSRFRNLGFVPDERMAAVFSAADVLVLPYTSTISASGPLSIALGYGLPVLLSRVFAGSYPGAPGLFAPEPGAIAAVLDAFFNDGMLRAAAHAFVRSLRERRTWSSMAQRMVDVYRSMPGRVTTISA